MILCVSFLCMVGCKKKLEGNESVEQTETADGEDSGITIQYIGNSCFKFVFKDGTAIVSDPYTAKYDSSFTEFPKDLSADVVLAYAGEYGNVKNEELFQELKDLNVGVIVPQHYSMKKELKFYREPTIDEILNQVPEEYEIVEDKTDEMMVRHVNTKKFVVLQKEY